LFEADSCSTKLEKLMLLLQYSNTNSGKEYLPVFLKQKLLFLSSGMNLKMEVMWSLSIPVHSEIP
jgi:hypothetical protein